MAFIKYFAYALRCKRYAILAIPPAMQKNSLVIRFHFFYIPFCLQLAGRILIITKRSSFSRPLRQKPIFEPPDYLGFSLYAVVYAFISLAYAFSTVFRRCPIFGAFFPFFTVLLHCLLPGIFHISNGKSS